MSVKQSHLLQYYPYREPANYPHCSVFGLWFKTDAGKVWISKAELLKRRVK